MPLKKYFAPVDRNRKFEGYACAPQTDRQVVFFSLRTLYERGDDYFFQQVEKFRSAGLEEDVEVALRHL